MHTYACDTCGLSFESADIRDEEFPCYIARAYNKALEARGLGKRSKKLRRITQEFAEILMKETGCKGRMRRQKQI